MAEEDFGAEETARLVREVGRRAVVARLDTTDAPGCGDVVPFVCIQRIARRMVDVGRGGRLIAVTSVHEHQPVAPGEISTPMNEAEDVGPHEVHRAGIPLGRPGDAREVAAVIAFLASPQTAYVTGASWAVDGGMLQMGPQAGSHLTSDDWRKA